MARVGRLAGGILAETEGKFYLVGNTKVPCDWGQAGFAPPEEINALARPCILLVPCRPVQVELPYLVVEVEGEALPQLLIEVFLIHRTGSISERLWQLVTGQRDEDTTSAAGVLQARWLGEIPMSVWHVVRDAVLRCT